MRPVRSIVLGFFAVLCAVAAAAGVPAAVAETGLYVDIRASDDADAPVVERWKLYGASYALVIGIDNYTGGWPRLSNAIKDARLVAEALRARGFEVKLLTNVTGDDLRKELRRFFAVKGADPEARLFVWFAGHGYTQFGEGYLVPADAPPPGSPEFLYTALHMGDVGSMVRIAQSKHVLAVFDSCFAGTIFSSQRARPPAAITAAVKRPVRQFLTSGDADQQVSDDGTFRNLFLRALRGEETSDANRDGYLTATELSLYLEARVINLTQGAQTPRGGKLRDPRFDQGDFVFLLPRAEPEPVPEAVVPAPAEPAQTSLELAFWNAIKDSDSAEDYAAYLEAYPAGAFAPLARTRARSLAAKAEERAAAAAAPPAEPDPTRLELALWSSIQGSEDAADYRAYLQTFPDGTFARLAEARLEGLSAPRVAALPPASAPAPELLGSYDGEWNLELWVGELIPKGVKIPVQVTNKRFLAKFRAGGWRVEISGRIADHGALKVGGALRHSGSRSRIIDATADYEDGRFRMGGYLKSASSKTEVDYRLELTPTSAGGGQQALAQQEVSQSAPQTAAVPSTQPLPSSTERYPYDGTWTGFASLLKTWCGGGKRRFDLTLRIENGRISGGDPDGAYKVKGEVDDQGRFKNAFLSSGLEMRGSLTNGRIQSTNVQCSGVLKLKRVAQD